MMVQKKIDQQSLWNRNSTPWYGSGPSDEVPVPILGPDLIDPRQAHLLRRAATMHMDAESVTASVGEAEDVAEAPA